MGGDRSVSRQPALVDKTEPKPSHFGTSALVSLSVLSPSSRHYLHGIRQSLAPWGLWIEGKRGREREEGESVR